MAQIRLPPSSLRRIRSPGGGAPACTARRHSEGTGGRRCTHAAEYHRQPPLQHSATHADLRPTVCCWEQPLVVSTLLQDCLRLSAMQRSLDCLQFYLHPQATTDSGERSRLQLRPAALLQVAVMSSGTHRPR
ncbi:hypothetical protein C2845_PM02G21760 [Panicum miliaceum]|uniref:Uncharacterized protein n=1 Tax=Panicum miliaceum TaxID=4540 RepID=A0A3L6S4Z5_PANMI|nr:hypothetical protein C2845_PM02G21760 [Panicum miliaceum]